MRREMNCRIGYTLFILMEILIQFVIIMARQIDDWWLFSAGVLTFTVLVKQNYRFVRRHK